MSVARRARPIANPSGLIDASGKLSEVIHLWNRGGIPTQIEVWMIQTPTLRILRSIHGRSNLGCAWILLLHAAGDLVDRGRWWMADFWRYRVLLRSPDREMNELAHEREDVTR